MNPIHSEARSLRIYAVPAVAGAAGLVVVAGLFGPARAADKADKPATVDFVKDIQPIFKESCVKCHKGGDARGPGRGQGGPGGPGAPQAAPGPAGPRRG